MKTSGILCFHRSGIRQAVLGLDTPMQQKEQLVALD